MHGPVTEIFLLMGVLFPVVFAHQGGKHRREQGKDERLHQSHKDLQQIERQDSNGSPDVRHQLVAHHYDRFEHVLSSENIPVQPEGERHRANTDRDNLDDPDSDEHGNEENPEKAGAVSFDVEDMPHESARADFPDAPKKPKHHENGSHREGHV